MQGALRRSRRLYSQPGESVENLARPREAGVTSFSGREKLLEDVQTYNGKSFGAQTCQLQGSQGQSRRHTASAQSAVEKVCTGAKDGIWTHSDGIFLQRKASGMCTIRAWLDKLHGCGFDLLDDQSELRASALLHERARHFLSFVAARGGLIILENARTPLSAPGCPSMRLIYCCYVAACQYGLPLPKAWAFWCNFSVLSAIACKCPRPPCYHPSFTGRRNPDGSFATHQTAATQMPWPRPLPLALPSCLPVQTQLLSRAGRLSFLPPSFGPSLPLGFRMGRALVAPPSGLA